MDGIVMLSETGTTVETVTSGSDLRADYHRQRYVERDWLCAAEGSDRGRCNPGCHSGLASVPELHSRLTFALGIFPNCLPAFARKDRCPPG